METEPCYQVVSGEQNIANIESQDAAQRLHLKMKNFLLKREMIKSDEDLSDVADDESEGSEDSGLPEPSSSAAASDEDTPDESDSSGFNGVTRPARAKGTANYRTLPNNHDKFLEDTFKLIMKDVVAKVGDRTKKVNKWVAPKELSELMDLEPRAKGESHEQLLHRLKDVIEYSVKTGHPRFVNQLFSSLDPYGLAGQLVTDALNTSQYTFEVAPVFTMMEEAVLNKMKEYVGFTTGDGIFAPGGSISNIMAISCARHKAFPETKKKGLFGIPELVVYTSELSHYSIKKAGCLLGIGEDNVRCVKTDEVGKMIPEDLEKQIIETKEQGARPFVVVATEGTTVYGAFDPINPLADICAKHGLWLHVDSAWGGGVLLSKKHRYLMKGVERADSVTWNPHKLLGVPQQCSVILCKHDGLLKDVHRAEATYLFQKDKFYDISYDTGDKTFQCGRKVDVLKFWLMWKAKGSEGFENHVDHLLDNTKYFVDMLKQREGFELVVSEPELTNVCFWYIPPSLRNMPDGPEFRTKLHKVAPMIKERMLKAGSMMITYQPQKELVNFFRLVLQNSATDFEDMEFFMQEIERLGEDIVI